MTTPTDYFAAVPATDLMRVIVALSTEVYALADRVRGLEAILAREGIDLAALDAPVEPAAFDAGARAVRDAFVRRVFAALERPAAPARAPAPKRSATTRSATKRPATPAGRAARTSAAPRPVRGAASKKAAPARRPDARRTRRGAA